MARTKKDEALEPKSEIQKIELDLGREDLNRLVGKLNEVIDKINQ